MNRNLTILLTMFILSGCLGDNILDNQPVFEIDCSEVVLPAEFESGTDTTVVLKVRSNRSWFAHLDDIDHPIDLKDPDARVRWASISEARNQNLTNAVIETTLEMTVHANRNVTPVNGVLNLYCEGAICQSIPVRQKGVPVYLEILPEYDGRVLSGECQSSMEIRTNSKWTAEVVESGLEDFKIENPSGNVYTNKNQKVRVSFKANPSTDPFDIKSARIRFNVQGKDEPVEYEFSQRGTFVVSFEDMSAFDPEIPDHLIKVDNYPDDDQITTRFCRPGKTQKEVDTFTYTRKYTEEREINMVIDMAQYMNFDEERAALYIMGSGVLPYIRFHGIAGLSLKKLSLGCVAKDEGAVHFAGNIVADDHEHGSSETIAYTRYISQLKWPTVTDGSLHYIDFDLSENGVLVEEGRGCTLRTSLANNTSNENCTKMYIKTVTLKYL